MSIETYVIQQPMMKILKPQTGLLVVFLLLVFFGGIFALDTSRVILSEYTKMKEHRSSGNDFVAFYTGAKNAVSSERKHVYEENFELDRILETYGTDRTSVSEESWYWFRYYLPPIFLFVLSPLTGLPLATAYLVNVGFSILAGGLLCWLLARMLWARHPVRLFFLAGLLSYVPFYISIIQVQPTIPIALLLTAAFLVLKGGQTRRAAIFLVLAAAKPHWIALPGLALVRTRPTALLPLILAGAVFLLLPFGLLGPVALLDYGKLLLGRGESDLANPEDSARFLSWLGFIRAATGGVHPGAAAVLSLVTLAVFAQVIRSEETSLQWAASLLAGLIVIPHSNPQDWLLAAPAVALLLNRPTRKVLTYVTVVLVFALYLGVNSWLISYPLARAGQHTLYVAPLVAFLLIVWCAVLPRLERVRNSTTLAPLTSQFSASPVP